MASQRSFGLAWILLIAVALVLIVLNLSLGSVSIPFSETVSIITGKGGATASHEQIILIFRLPRIITAIAVGSGLAVSGLLMQTLFRNPLAGPYVLGISSGASLGVALVVLAGSTFAIGMLTGKLSILLSAGLGAAVILFVVILISKNITESATLLIIGLMFGSISGAIVSVLQYYSQADYLQSYMVWTFGNLGNVRWNDMSIFLSMVGAGLIFAMLIHKPLNTLMLSDQEVSGLGVNLKRTRYIILLATSILAGTITAYCGPIAFVGLAVPHLTRVLFPTSDHKVLLPAVALSGVVVMVFADLVSQLPGSSHILPVNAVTAIIGGPVVIWVIVRRRTLGRSFR